MLTLEQIITEATALPDTDKAILIDRILDSMRSQVDDDVLLKGVQQAQERIAEIDCGVVVQTLPGDITLALCRNEQVIKMARPLKLEKESKEGLKKRLGKQATTLVVETL